MRRAFCTAFLLAGLAGSPAAAPAAPAAQTICVFDLVGAAGSGYNFAKDYALAMQKVGADIHLKVYTDERVAIEDFKTGQCDGVTATGMRTRAFVPTTAAIDSFGATTIVRDGQVDLPASYEAMHKAIQVFAAPAAARFVTEGPYEVAGIAPLGAVFLVLNDRRINSVEAAAGKRVAAFDHDKAQSRMIQRLGATPVSTDVTNFATKFNNGVVDIAAAPAMAFKPLELYRGIGSKGGVVRFPMLILSYQMVIRSARFPAGFGEASRQFWAGQFDTAMKVISAAEREIPASLWMDMSPKDTVRYSAMIRESRIDLVQQGLYDKRGLKVLKKIRCSLNPADGECSTSAELD